MAKVLITMPDTLLADIDRAAQARGVSRSRFLREAAARELRQPEARAIEAALRQGQAALAGVGVFDSASEIAAQRREHDTRDRGR